MDLSLYIHIPFCIKKCLYCDFLSFPLREYEDSYEDYIDVLCEEISQIGRLFQTQFNLVTVFIGGGTPSLLPEAIERIDKTLRESFDTMSIKEYSIELNPKTLTERLCKVLERSLINRVSIGCQSAIDSELKALGRVHDFKDFLETYHRLRDIGIANINIDLMADIPGQTLESYRSTLDEIIRLKPQHISAYSLIIEPGTIFFDMEKRGELIIPDEETDRLMYQMTEEKLKKIGYKRYEISNYALEGRECIHNLVYWNRGNYIGVGLGASSYIKDKGYGVRFNNPKSHKTYKSYVDRLKKVSSLSELLESPSHIQKDDVQFLTEKEAMQEFFFLGLRKTEGVSLKKFENDFKVSAKDIYGDVIKKLVNLSLLDYNAEGDKIHLTHKGLDLSNFCMSEFM